MEHSKIEVIDIEEANELSITQIQTRIGKSKRLLIDEYGMSKDDARDFIVNIMRLTVAAEHKATK